VPDRIELRGLRASGICGALPEEQVRAQPFEIDLDVVVDLSTAGRTDALDDTVDYGALCEAVERVVTTERFTLMERMAERIGEVVLGDARVSSTAVTVRKLRPPVPQHLGTAGVRVERAR
jgi:7,8-dihydroneopterin aldolase/epimerase/oxygenase